MAEEQPHEIEQVAAELVQQGWIRREELCTQLGIDHEILEVCLQWEIIHPPEINQKGVPLFPEETLDRLSRGLRLHRDLGIDWPGVLVALDLLDRIEELEHRAQERFNL